MPDGPSVHGRQAALRRFDDQRLTAAHTTLAEARDLAAAGNVEKALAAYDEVAYAANDALGRGYVGRAKAEGLLLAAYVGAAELRAARGEPEAALHQYRQALAVVEGLLNDDPSDIAMLLRKADLVLDAGRLLEALGEADEALYFYRAAAAIMAQQISERSQDVRLQERMDAAVAGARRLEAADDGR